MQIKGWTTWGSVRGQGPVRHTKRRAQLDLTEDQQGCASPGGYSDRQIYAIDAEGYVVDPETGWNVYPYGAGAGALKVDVSEMRTLKVDSRQE